MDLRGTFRTEQGFYALNKDQFPEMESNGSFCDAYVLWLEKRAANRNDEIVLINCLSEENETILPDHDVWESYVRKARSMAQPLASTTCLGCKHVSSGEGCAFCIRNKTLFDFYKV